jgi:TonB dependent receptor
VTSLAEDVFVSAIMFQSAFFNLTDPLASFSATTGPEPSTFDDRSRGHAIGLELTARRRLTRKLGGYFTYTLSRSTRTTGGVIRRANFDRTHVANAALSYDFGRGYRAGIRLLFYTGTPSRAATPEDDKRLPPFFRLDVRLEKRWTLGKRVWMSVVLEVLNATLSKESISETCEGGTCTPQSFGPVTVPSLGVEGGF